MTEHTPIMPEEPGGSSPEETPPPSDQERLIARARAQASAARSSTLIDPNAIPGYEIVREIHRGGQGVVHLAIQRSTKRKVALKVLHAGPAQGSRGRTRFEREVELLGRLDHPNIVSVLDSGEIDGWFYYAMDYVSGLPLDVYVKEHEPTMEEALRLFAQICETINAAHLRGIIHRDLKPANILIGADAQPHIVDFGLAKIAIGEVADDTSVRLMSMTGEFIGSLPWASPEQAGGSPEAIDVRTDVYSLGVILYQMLTSGRFPYEVIGNMREVLDNILRAQPVRPSTIRRQINNELETIVLMALAKERDRRYQSAGELGRDVERYLSGRPIQAKRDSGWYLVTKTLGAHKAAVAVASVFAAMVLVSAVLMTVLYTRAEDARLETAAALARATEAAAAEQVERERAERHFGAVREMARTFLFDFHESIENTRGTTRSQELIVTEALEYLRRIMGETPDDPGLLREVADAYDRVGDIQGGLSEQHLGDTDAAESSYDAALEIRRRLLERIPDDARSHADVASSRVRLGAVMRTARRFDDSVRSLEEAGLSYDRAISRAEEPEPYRREQIRAFTELADTFVVRALDTGDSAEAQGLLDRAGRLYERAESFWAGRDSADDERARLDAAGAMNKRVLAAVTGVRLRIASGDASRDAGDTERAGSEYAFALEQLEDAVDVGRRAVELAEGIERDHPSSAAAQRMRFRTLHDWGEVVMRVGAVHDRMGALGLGGGSAAAAREANDRAIEIFREALSSAERAAGADESDAGAQRDLAVALNKVGTVLLALDDAAGALPYFDRSREVRELIVSTDPTPRARHDLALAHYKIGEAERALAPVAAGRTASLAHLDRATAAYRESLDLYRALESEGRLEPGSRYTRVVEGRIADVEREKGEIGADNRSLRSTLQR
ncbi:MAG: serine/threonine-protein kinase [Phycisphaerales bacterium]